MADSFGISQIVDYIQQMGLQIAAINSEQETVELAFHGNHGQWRMIIGFQQANQVRKLVLIIPHIGTVTRKKRLECLEALMAVNYRIAMGKFGLDLDDGEVRLEESVPLADASITFAQFQLALRALVQTVAMYQSLIPRIIYGNISANAALEACEQEFLQGEALPTEHSDEEEAENDRLEPAEELEAPPAIPPELNVQDVMDEVSRLFEEHREL
jgi:hypothetical protein